MRAYKKVHTRICMYCNPELSIHPQRIIPFCNGGLEHSIESW
jgi:hypothetical protein